MATVEDFLKLDIRAGEVVKAEFFEKAQKPALQLWVDFGDEIGIRKSSAQITECYTVEGLIGKQVLGVVNLPPKRIAGFESEALILGIFADQGVVLIQPERPVRKGDKLG